MLKRNGAGHPDSDFFCLALLPTIARISNSDDGFRLCAIFSEMLENCDATQASRYRWRMPSDDRPALKHYLPQPGGPADIVYLDAA